MLISKGHQSLVRSYGRGSLICLSVQPECLRPPPPFVIPHLFLSPLYKNDTQSRYTFEQNAKEKEIYIIPGYIFYYKCFLMLFVLCYLGFDLSRFLLKIGRPTAGASCVLSFWSLVPSTLSAINNPNVLIQRTALMIFWGDNVMPLYTSYLHTSSHFFCIKVKSQA